MVIILKEGETICYGTFPYDHGYSLVKSRKMKDGCVTYYTKRNLNCPNNLKDHFGMIYDLALFASRGRVKGIEVLNDELRTALAEAGLNTNPLPLDPKEVFDAETIIRYNKDFWHFG